MAFILGFIIAYLLNPSEAVALHYAGCRMITQPLDANTVAVKWVCPNR
jgi:hypothetical protein